MSFLRSWSGLLHVHDIYDHPQPNSNVAWSATTWCGSVGSHRAYPPLGDMLATSHWMGFGPAPLTSTRDYGEKKKGGEMNTVENKGVQQTHMTKQDTPPHHHPSKQTSTNIAASTSQPVPDQTCPPHRNAPTTPGQHHAHTNPGTNDNSQKNAGEAPHLPAAHRLLATTDPTTTSPAAAPPHTRCGTQHTNHSTPPTPKSEPRSNTLTRTHSTTQQQHTAASDHRTQPHIHTRVSNIVLHRHGASSGIAHHATQHRLTATSHITTQRPVHTTR